MGARGGTSLEGECIILPRRGPVGMALCGRPELCEVFNAGRADRSMSSRDDSTFPVWSRPVGALCPGDGSRLRDLLGGGGEFDNALEDFCTGGGGADSGGGDPQVAVLVDRRGGVGALFNLDGWIGGLTRSTSSPISKSAGNTT